MAHGKGTALVVGAGVTGLAAAVALAQRGWSVEVWEARSRAGGLLAPFRFRGVDCDLGSHRLHPVALQHPFVRDLLAGLDLPARARRGRLVLGGRRLGYPPSLPGLLGGLGLRRSLSLGISFLTRRADLQRFGTWEEERRQGVAAGQDVGFERFVRERVGRAAYEGFYRPYAEKVWGLPPAELSQTVAKKRVSTSSPLRLLGGPARALAGRPDAFLYPRLGMAELMAHLVRRARDLGVRVRVGRRFAPRRDGAGRSLVVHSGRLRDLAPGCLLEHRGSYLVYVALPTERVSRTETWYLPESRYWFGRVSEPQNYSAALRRTGETALCLEIPEGRWGRGVDFVARTDTLLAQLRDAGVVSGRAEPLEVAQHFLPDVYPLYRRGWQDAWAVAMARVASLGNVFPVGRQGLFLHCNIDHCVRMADDLAGHVDAGGGAQAWVHRARRYLGCRVHD